MIILSQSFWQKGQMIDYMKVFAIGGNLKEDKIFDTDKVLLKLHVFFPGQFEYFLMTISARNYPHVC